MAPLRFFFDYISPYAYVGWHMAQKLAREHERELVAEPILFAALLNAHGTKGPAEIPAKRSYTFKDVYRKAHAAGLTLVPPPGHPFNPLLALRATGVLTGEDRAKAVTALYAATWAGGGGVETAEAVARALTSAGLDGAAVIERAGSSEAKASLKARTDEALTLGAFGVPTLDVDGELFWGVDGLAFAAGFLEGRDPVPRDLLARWADLPASATRAAKG
jgi:2-hydroxychromene-2-carboxylate isomerase